MGRTEPARMTQYCECQTGEPCALLRKKVGQTPMCTKDELEQALAMIKARLAALSNGKEPDS